jgi:amidophosphoribosyltransferase
MSPQRDLVDRIVDALRQVEGAYSLVCLTDRGARRRARSPRHPPAVPRRVRSRAGPGGDEPRASFASEPTSFDLIGAEFVRDVAPGELLVIDDVGPALAAPLREASRARACIFEHVYFARPDSTLGGASVYEVRKALGRAPRERSTPLPASKRAAPPW